MKTGTTHEKTKDAVLEIRGLKTDFISEEGTVRAVDGVDLTIEEGESVALVGESGCGKTVLALSILRLFPTPAGSIAGGSVLYRGVDLATLSSTALRAIRGNRIAMVFQEPSTFLNPCFTVGEQIAEGHRLHNRSTRGDSKRRALKVMEQVGIPVPSESYGLYPHQLSGGLKQRVLIAMALVCGPDLLIADEPTTSVDATVQAQIMGLLKDFRKEGRMALLLITHDLNLVFDLADRVLVMYASRIVEEGPTLEVLENPAHPYTLGLLRSRPARGGGKGRLDEIPGKVPDLLRLPKGCRFHPRCFKAKERCRVEDPALTQRATAGMMACHFPLDGDEPVS